MKKIVLSNKSKDEFMKNKPGDRVQFISYVADQFRRLAKKNLRIPVQMYQL